MCVCTLCLARTHTLIPRAPSPVCQFRVVDFVTALQSGGVISSSDQASGLVVRLDPAGTRTAAVGSLRVLVR